MEKFHKIVTEAKILANRRGLQGKQRTIAMGNYVSEELSKVISITS